MPDVTGDPPRSRADAWAWVLIGLFGLPLLAIAVGTIVLPPGVAIILIKRGLTEGRSSWVAFGVLAALLWLFFLALAGRRLFRRRVAGDR